MTPRELAAAIRKGHTMAPEGNHTMPGVIQDCACALGAAWLGSGKTAQEYWRVITDSRGFYGKFADGLGIAVEMAETISIKHSRGTPRLAIADWLDTLEPAHRQTFESFMQATLKHVEIEHPAIEEK